MNAGVISRRYATALFKLVTETGHGEEVYAQVKALLKDPDTAPKPLCEELEQLTALLVRNGRMPYVRLVLGSFLQQYERAAGIHNVRLVTAVDSPALRERLLALLNERVGGRIELQSRTDPSLIGGFVLTLDDYKLDASVSRQLEEVRRQLIEKNKRIV